jgi:antitoxin component YwqK of YwqJK toxin-antitoxin module
MRAALIVILCSIMPFVYGQLTSAENDLGDYSGHVIAQEAMPVFIETEWGTQKGNSFAGRRDGEWRAWNKDGELQAIAFFQNGKKEGIWLIYNREGKLLYSLHYDNGQLNVAKEWGVNGELVAVK